MRRNNQDGTKRVALWVLSSTCLPPRDIPRALTDFEEAGYLCQESHGVRGHRRTEIAGVMVCVDPKQLQFSDVGSRKGVHKRVVRRGRVMRVKLRVVGANDKESDFDVLACYMPTRGRDAAGGHASAAEKEAYVLRVWRGLAITAMPIAAHGRLLIAGDLNAELMASLRRASRRQQRSDACLAQLVDFSRVSRVHHEGDWTFTMTMHGQRYTSTIDHMLASDSMRNELSRARTVDGVEVGQKRHRALEAVLRPAGVLAAHEVGEQRVPQVRVCAFNGPAERAAYEECKRDYQGAVGSEVDKQVAEAGGWSAPTRMLLDVVQRATEAAMRTALGGEEADAAGKAGVPKRASGESTRQRAVFWEAALTERRTDIGADAAHAPRSLEGWRKLFIKPPMRRGLPMPYASFHEESEVGRRVQQVYSAALEHQMLGAFGGECATEADAAVPPVAEGEAPIVVWEQRSESAADHDTRAVADHYAVLGIARAATRTEVATAYKQQALRCHPDKGSPEQAAERTKRFQRVGEAYAVLSDAEQRAEYDAANLVHGAQQSDGSPSSHRASRWHTVPSGDGPAASAAAADGRRRGGGHAEGAQRAARGARPSAGVRTRLPAWGSVPRRQPRRARQRADRRSRPARA